MRRTNNVLLNALRHHVTGAIERGEGVAIVGITQNTRYRYPTSYGHIEMSAATVPEFLLRIAHMYPDAKEELVEVCK